MRCYIHADGQAFGSGGFAPGAVPGSASCCTCGRGGGACAAGEVCVKTEGNGGRCQPVANPASVPAAASPRTRSPIQGSVIGHSLNDMGPMPRPAPRSPGTPDAGSGGPAGPSPAPAGLLAKRPRSAGRTMRQLLEDDGGWMGGQAAPGAAGLGDLGILYGAAAQGAGDAPSAGSPGRRMREEGGWVGGAGGSKGLGDTGDPVRRSSAGRRRRA